MNKVILIGRTTKDIELKTTTTGKAIVNFNLAVNRTFKNGNGEYESDFFTCIAFGNLAETINRYVKKGDLVGIEGRLQTRNYTDREGKKHYLTEVMVENIDFLQPKKQQGTTVPQTEEPQIDPFDDLPF